MSGEYMTEAQAVEFSESKAWEPMTFRQRAEFQISVERLCMPFDVFHEAISEALGRDVYTHEFGLNLQGLRDELFDGAGAPSLKEIIEMIPKDKRVILVAVEDTEAD